jgi:hypothetical protein
MYCFYVNRGCKRWWIHASPVEAVWLTISESTVDQFSLTISESTGVGVLTNTRVTYGSGFADDFWVCSGSIFVDYLWIKRGCVLSQIQASPVEGVSLMISESAPTLFLLNFSKSTGATSASEYTHHLCKVFRWWFLSRQRLSFHWLFLTQKGLWALTNPRVTFGICFGDDYGVGRGLVFIDCF